MPTMSAEARNSAHNNDKAKGGPVITEKLADQAYATTEEICEAVESLTEAELGRIHRAAMVPGRSTTSFLDGLDPQAGPTP